MPPATVGLARAVSGSLRLRGTLPGASAERAPVCISQSSGSVSREPRSRFWASPSPPAVAPPAGQFPGVTVEQTDAQADVGRWRGVRASRGACLVHEAAESSALMSGGDVVSPVLQAHRQQVCVWAGHTPWTWTWVAGQPRAQTWVGAACCPAALWAEVPAWLALRSFLGARPPASPASLPLAHEGALSHSRT